MCVVCVFFLPVIVVTCVLKLVSLCFSVYDFLVISATDCPERLVSNGSSETKKLCSLIRSLMYMPLVL